MIDLNHAKVAVNFVPMDQRHVKDPRRDACIACGLSEREIIEQRIVTCANWQRGLTIMFAFACEAGGHA